MNGVGRVVVGSIAGGLLGAAAFFVVDGLVPNTANAGKVMSSCWRMTNDQPYAAGVGPGMDWKILGTCYVTLNSQEDVIRIQVIKPKMDLWMKPYGPETNFAVTKPYQNPVGTWMIGIWETSARRSAIFATKTWNN